MLPDPHSRSAARPGQAAGGAGREPPAPGTGAEGRSVPGDARRLQKGDHWLPRPTRLSHGGRGAGSGTAGGF